MLILRGSVIPTFAALKDTLAKKLVEAESDWT